MKKHQTKKPFQNHYSKVAHEEYQFEEENSLDVNATAYILKSSGKKWLCNVVAFYIRLSELACNQLCFNQSNGGGGGGGGKEGGLNAFIIISIIRCM